jgi:Tfx family DNA-binding protein
MAGDDGRDGGQETDSSSESDWSVDEFLSELGFVAEESVLTHRQAEVLVLRERGYKQASIADQLGTSRANVSSIEASARENVEKARETVRFAELVSPPVHVEIPPETDLYTVPEIVFEACDDVDVKVSHSAPELMRIIRDETEDAIENNRVQSRLFVNVTADGTVWVRET